MFMIFVEGVLEGRIHWLLERVYVYLDLVMGFDDRLLLHELD